VRIIELVNKNGAIKQCREDAQEYVNRAGDCLSLFAESQEKESLLKLNQFIVNRSH
jgi:geranylgeranyl pyrophosphate synthase